MAGYISLSFRDSFVLFRMRCPSIVSSIAIKLNVSRAIELTFVILGHGFKRVLCDICAPGTRVVS